MNPLLFDNRTLPVRLRRLVLVVPALLAAASCFSPPTLRVPSEPRAEARVGSVSFTVTAATLDRNFAPRVLDPGPDGGGALTGTISIRVHNGGQDGGQDGQRFNLAAAVYDERGERHLVTAVPRVAGRPLVWDGTITPGRTLDLEVAIGSGPYVEVGSRAFVVLMFVRQDGDTGTLRTPPLEVRGARSHDLEI